MKLTRLYPAMLACCLALIAFPGCLEVETTTRVNGDGTLQREIVLHGDSADVFQRSYPFRFDAFTPGKIQRMADGKFKQTFSRSFANAEQLNDALRVNDETMLNVSVTVEKKFRWFFTTLVYSETYHRFDPYHGVPIENYLSKEQRDRALEQMLHRHADSSKTDSLPGKVYEAWSTRNVFEAFYSVFAEGARKANDPNISPDSVRSRKELLFEKGAKAIEEGDFEKLKPIVAEVMHAPVDRIIEANKAAFERFAAKRTFVNRLLQCPLKVSVTLPGLITSTNAPTLKGNKATWNDFMTYCYFSDYTLVIESRSTNWWAIITSGFVVLALVVLLVISIIRRRAIV